MRYGRLMAMAIVFAGAPFAPAALAQQYANQPQKWEYKVVNYCDPENRAIDEREHIQYLGEEEWELVSADTQVVSEATKCSSRAGDLSHTESDNHRSVISSGFRSKSEIGPGNETTRVRILTNESSSF